MLYKKGQGISLNVIIIAAIALLVLVVLAVIFLGRLNFWSGEVNDCQNKNGQCFTDGVSCGSEEASDYPIPVGWSCPEEQHCCVS